MNLAEVHRQRLEAFSALCREIGEDEATVSIAWVLHNPVVTSVIIGPRTTEQLQSCIKAEAVQLDKELMDKLNHIFS
ncbi:MAG TPA: hypothetical protein DD727_07775 [Clostridiales bacterium]|nr:hypothetical protein [Clostridiales bacterium]